MKKVLAIIAAVMLLGIGRAYAVPIMFDIGAAGIPNAPLGDGNTRTGVFDQLSVYVETTSTPTSPTTFSDVGDIKVNGLLAPITPDSELLGSWWEMTGRWENLTGNITGVTPIPGGTLVSYVYTGGSLNLYADGPYPGLLPNSNFNGDGGSNDGSSDDVVGTFTDGTLVASLNLIGGTGSLNYDSNGQPTTGSTLLRWQFSSMLPGFWLDANGNDLKPLSDIGWVLAFSDTNTHQIKVRGVFIDSNHDGSVDIGIVPEPTSMLLLGIGMLGLATVRRKKVA